MSRLNLKLKTSLKTKIAAEEQTSGASKKDPRYLNYFDMKEGQRMEVLFLPDASGESSWSADHVHGPRVKVGQQRIRGVKPIACSRLLAGEKCVICDEMFLKYQESDKEGGNRLQVTERYTAQVLVLKSDIEVQYPDDGNVVKLFNVPESIMKKVKQAIMEEQVDEDEMYLTPFVIKVTKNGEYNQYDTSYFARKNVSEAEFEELTEGKTVTQYDFSTGDFVTPLVDPQAQQEWLDDVTLKINTAMGATTGGTGGTGGATGSTGSTGGGSVGRSAYTKTTEPETEEFDNDVPDSVTDGDEPVARNNVDSLRARLKK